MLSRRSLAVWATVAFLYVLVSCILCAQGALELAPDSVRSLPPVDVWSPQQPGVLTALMFQLVGGGGSNVKVLLTTTSVVSWLGLSFVTFLNFKGSVTGFLLATSVLGYSLLPFISGWRFLALSEDVSISTTVMWVACMLVIPLCSTRRCLGVALVVAAVAGLLAVATRPQMALVVLPTQITVLVLARRRAHLVPIGLVLAMTVFSAAFAWIRLDQLQHLDVWMAAYAENNLVAKGGFARYATRFLSSCHVLLEATTSFETLDPVRGRIPESCPDAWAWLSGRGSSGAVWILRDPWGAASSFAEHLLRARLVTYRAGAPWVPFWNTLATVRLTSAAVVCSAASGALMTLLWVKGWRFRRDSLAVLTVAGLGSLVYLCITWASDGMEWERHMIPVITLFPIGILILPALALCAPRQTAAND